MFTRTLNKLILIFDRYILGKTCDMDLTCTNIESYFNNFFDNNHVSVDICSYGVNCGCGVDNSKKRYSYLNILNIIKNRCDFIEYTANIFSDNNDILIKSLQGSVQVDHSYTVTCCRLIKNIISDISDISDIRQTSVKNTPTSNLYLLWLTFSYCLTSMLRRGVGLYRKINSEKMLWQVKVVDKNTGNNYYLPKEHELNNAYYADPFFIKFNDVVYLFVEKFLANSQKGIIQRFIVSSDELIDDGVALEEPFHLSFPFMFVHDECLYMLPEAHKSNQIRLYRYDEQEGKFTLYNVLLDNVSAADSLLFMQDNTWWLLTNIDKTGCDLHTSRLYIYSANNLKDKKWIPHQNNPVINDISKARNGGFFIKNGIMYRVGQMQGFGIYGAGYSINKIKLINNYEYTEVTIKKIYASDFGALGSHHFSTIGSYTACDEYVLKKVSVV